MYLYRNIRELKIFSLIIFLSYLLPFARTQYASYPGCRQGQSCLGTEELTPVLENKRLEAKVLARSCGFRTETHSVVTGDGYILQIHHLINPLISPKLLRGTIIIQHGILCSSSFWLLNANTTLDRPQQAHIKRFKELPTSNSLAIALANHGYDIWLTNFRGTQYGRKHTKTPVMDSKFWKFNIDSLIEHDFETNVKYILRVTNATDYTYIGHSLGATVGLGALIAHKDKPTIMKQSCSVLLAPVANTQFMNSSLLPMFRMAAMMYDDLAPFPGTINQLALYARHICVILPKLCTWAASLFVGLDKEAIAQETLGLTSQSPKLESFDHMMQQSVSIQVIKHIIQVHTNGRLAKFDYGYTGNKEMYGIPTPPSYDILSITARKIKATIIGAVNDVISTRGELDWIYQRLRRVLSRVEYNMIDAEPFNHMDLVLSDEAGVLVNDNIIDFIKENRCFPPKRY